MRRAARLVAFVVAYAIAPRVALATPRITVFDDGEKLRGEANRPLPPTALADPLDLFALPGETIGLQFVIDADDEAVADAHVLPLTVGAQSYPVTNYFEWFVKVPRPSGNEREPGSLAFTAEAAPPKDAFVGLVADALVRRPLHLDAHARGALWADVFVPDDARPGVYEVAIALSLDGAVVERRAKLEVGATKMPYAPAKVTTFYDPKTLARRIGRPEAEIALRRELHAHHVSAITERTDPDALGPDLDALKGVLYTRPAGYEGPGEGVGEGVYAIGAYGSLGDPDREKLARVERFVKRIEEAGALANTDAFVYAVDEDCKSRRAQRWLALLDDSPARGKVRVGVTCSDPPPSQAATLAMVPAYAYEPDTAEAGKRAGKVVWAYNGIRPQAGPMMLDVPATDLRANAWIGARYDVTRWFYWESTFWLDDNRGGKGGAEGFDPYVTAETFHNADGDYAMGDGVLVYPATQKNGMTDFGEPGVFPSVRLKNVRRGILDAGYIALARAKDADKTDAIVRRMIPRALVRARDRAAWPEDATAWRAARRELFRIVEGPIVKPATSAHPAIEPADEAPRGARRGCGHLGLATALVAVLAALAVGLWRRLRGTPTGS